MVRINGPKATRGATGPSDEEPFKPSIFNLELPSSRTFPRLMKNQSSQSSLQEVQSLLLETSSQGKKLLKSLSKEERRGLRKSFVKLSFVQLKNGLEVLKKK